MKLPAAAILCAAAALPARATPDLIFGVNTGTPVDYLQAYMTDSINFRLGQYNAGYNPGGSWAGPNVVITGPTGLWSTAVNYADGIYTVGFDAPDPAAVGLSAGGIFSGLSAPNISGTTYTATVQIHHDGGDIKAGGGNINVNTGPANPVTNFHVLRPGGTLQGLTPQFAGFFNVYQGGRYMNNSNVNNNNSALTAADVLPAGQNLSGAGGLTDYGNSIEDQIAWTNANPKARRMFVNIPYGADRSYVEKVARLVATKLRGDVEVVVEIGNEPWNFLFTGAGYLLNRANSDLAHQYPDGDSYTRVADAYGVTAAEKVAWFKGIMPRATGFLNSQASNQWFVDHAKSTIDLNFGAGAVATLFKYQGGSFYPADNAGALGSAQAIFDTAEADLQRQADNLRRDAIDAHNSGLKEIAYEVSPNGYLTSGQTSLAVSDAFRSSTLAGTLTTDTLNAAASVLTQDGEGLMMFTVAGDLWPTQINTLGPKEPEQVALEAWMASHQTTLAPEPNVPALAALLGAGWMLLRRKR